MSSDNSRRASDQQASGQQSPAFDDALRAALHEVDVPSDLCEKTIARLREGAVSPAARETPPAGSAWKRFTRRQALAAAASIALAAIAGLSVVYWHRSPRSVGRGELCTNVTGWLNSLSSDRWKSITALPPSVPIDPAVAAGPWRWQTIHFAGASRWSASVTAIDLSPPGTPRAVLFVIRSHAQFELPPAPAMNVRLPLSGGFAGTAWQRSPGVCYVLVVETSPARRLEDFLRRPAQA